MASNIGFPMFPQATARNPAACKMWVTSSVVVVLPLVPVMVIHFATRSVLSLRRTAKSISVRTWMSFFASQRIVGCDGAKPGDTTAKSIFTILLSSDTASESTSFAPMTSRSSEYSGLADCAKTVTSAPSSQRVSATEKPDLPKPKTATCSPAQLSCQLRCGIICRRSTPRRTGQRR